MKNVIGETKIVISKMQAECESRDFLFINFNFSSLQKIKKIKFYDFNIIFEF